MSQLLEIEGIEAGYGDVQVLWGVDLAIEDGAVTCLVGSNGAGKTTLLRTISGLIRPKSGRMRFAGQDITSAGPDDVLASGIAHVPEGRRLFRGLSVRDNLLLGAYLRKDGEVQTDLARIYEIFPILAERRHQDATTLSGGEQQMCAIGRGIMSRPRLLMIDELSLGLAPKAVESLTETIATINADGITILLVEQDVITAFDLAEHAFVLDMGRVTRSGTTLELTGDKAIREAYMGF